jgi:hypothetical protein
MNVYVEIDKLTKKKPRKKQRAADDGLRPLFFKNLKHDCQWSPIETGDITGGVPDATFCFDGGIEGWVEFKATEGWKPVFRPLQVAWIDRRSRLGGRVWVATRRRVKLVDDLYMTPGFHVKELATQGFTDNVLEDTYCFTGGPRTWRWSEVRRVLCS